MTPKYVFSKKKIEDCYYSLCEKMNGVRLFYSLKANAEKEVLQILNDIGVHFEIASIGEFNILKEMKVASNRIICGLPIKPANWLQYMYTEGCLYYVFDSINELEKLIEYAPVSKKILRINICDLIPKSIEFGMEYNDAWCLVQDVEMVKYVDGISFHISNNINVFNFNCVMDRVETLLPFLSSKEILLNIGGGYRIDAPEDFYENLQLRVFKLNQKYNIEIIAEPGNALVNSAGSIYTTVIGVKNRKTYTDIYIDVGKPSGMKTDYKRLPNCVNVIGKSRCEGSHLYRFIDITCMHKPHFSWELEYVIEEGDVIEFTNMGAYTVCLQSKFHLWDSPQIEIVF